MAQGVPDTEVEQLIKDEEKLIHDDPLHDVKEELLSEVDVTKSVQDSGEKLPPPQSVVGDDVVKSDVKPVFAEEYKKDHENQDKK